MIWSPEYKHYADFQASNMWLQRLCDRNNLGATKLLGIGGDVDLADAAQKIANFKAAIAATGVTDPNCIYNADETGLFYAQMPSYVIVPNDAVGLRGGKSMVAEERVTLMLCASATGNKVPLLVIGRAVTPRAFYNGVHPPGTHYDQQSQAWITAELCQKWFLTIFLPAKRKQVGDKKAILFWDNLQSPQDYRPGRH